MDKLSAKPFEYFIAGIGFILVLVGIFGQPWKDVSSEELWAISIFGGISLISAYFVAVKKAEFTLKTNLEKIEYQKFLSSEKTKRLELSLRDHTEADLSDLESF